jgi:hypothetical protein
LKLISAVAIADSFPTKPDKERERERDRERRGEGQTNSLILFRFSVTAPAEENVPVLSALCLG